MKQVIHIHVPRTAGKSMLTFGKTHAESFQSLYRSHGVKFDPSVQWTYFGHNRLDYLTKHRNVTKEWYDSCFKFAFVRNTWERLVSLYTFHRTRKWRKDGGHPTWEHVVDFPTFVRHLVQNEEATWPKFRHRQLAWLEFGVDFVGRFDRLDEDWEELCGLIGVEHRPLIRRNATAHADYREYYPRWLRRSVGRFYADEIERFGFEFGA